MNLALFDFDGTVTTSDTWTPFIRESATRPRALAAVLLLSPVIAGYKLGIVSARTSRPMVAWFAFRGRSAADVRELGRKYAAEILPDVVRPFAIERIHWHRTRGDDVVVVSASLDVYLRAWCSSHGVDLICTRLEERQGMLTGHYVGGECSGEEKARRIRARYDLSRYAVVYAYGDTDEDREMLAMAHEKYYRWQRVHQLDSLSVRHPDRRHV